MQATSTAVPHLRRTPPRPDPSPLGSKFLFDPDEQLPPERFYWKDFLWKGDVNIWLGREKHRKTNLLLQLAICGALGHDFLNFRFVFDRPLRVVVVDYESKPHSLKRRYEAIAAAMGLTTQERTLLKENLRIIQVRAALRAGLTVPKFDASTRDYWQEFVNANPADIYVIDPMRSLHGRDENDSAIETLLADLRNTFKETVILAHHMRKPDRQNGVVLENDMRAWSDDARGSTAIKAHADGIICQERRVDPVSGDEVVYWGAFLKDAQDVDPMPLRESGPESCHWEVSVQVPLHLKSCYDALKKAGGKFKDRASASHIVQAAGSSRATAYRHVGQLLQRGLLTVGHEGLVLSIEAAR